MRRSLTAEQWDDISRKIQSSTLTLAQRAALRFKLFLEYESDWIDAAERIPARRTLASFPDIYAPGEKERLTSGFHVHEQGRVCNISSDWAGVLREGLLPRRERCAPETVQCIDAALEYADRYGDERLSQAMRTGASSFLDALRMFRILHFCLWASNVYHNTVGRFDQYMYPYYVADKQNIGLDSATVLSLLEEFFLSFNRDSDLYQGMQQGDNGQSMMLGGCDRDGRCAVNELTSLCITASLNIRKIDPKINLRVDKNTPLELLVKCTELTRLGLGFPQYSNDDIVIPALVKLGYSIEDARDYTVAACWEFIIPGLAMDIPNIDAISLAGAADTVIRAKLAQCRSFAQLLEEVRAELFARADALEAALKPIWIEPAPFQSALMSDPTRDISEGAKYNNYGIHGTGFATAVDQLAAVKKYIYDERSIDPNALLDAMNDAFARSAELKYKLRAEAPKLGRDSECEPIADYLLDAFADSWAGRKNERGGVFRPGTGSAMYYLWHADELGALADGHMPGEPLSANFSPSLLVSDAGPLSVIQAMARPGIARVINGGPLTLELSDTVFKNDESLEKVGQLVRGFIILGGHQMQLNAVNRQTLLSAQHDPDNHRGLIVRVWGWSGHFVQLDKSYQDQIIKRTSYKV
ncbi:MAG: pyruvate formate-lyase [Oscillospiraceae bacterium]|jgi:formate C-acetyltransferase|nr:pyruvate formate-lyase [Oscillospiraceae bacterium]